MYFLYDLLLQSYRNSRRGNACPFDCSIVQMFFVQCFFKYEQLNIEQSKLNDRTDAKLLYALCVFYMIYCCKSYRNSRRGECLSDCSETVRYWVHNAGRIRGVVIYRIHNAGRKRESARYWVQ